MNQSWYQKKYEETGDENYRVMMQMFDSEPVEKEEAKDLSSLLTPDE